jgi:hypothetical protein
VAGNIVREAPLPVWANLRHRALDVAIAEINVKTDLNIAVESLERSGHRRVDALIFAIRTQTVQDGDSKRKRNGYNGPDGQQLSAVALAHHRDRLAGGGDFVGRICP